MAITKEIEKIKQILVASHEQNGMKIVAYPLETHEFIMEKINELIDRVNALSKEK